MIRIFFLPVEEFIDGIPLSDIVKMKEPVKEDILIEWTYQLCHILKHLHSQKPKSIIYQDMKPSNVIVGHDGILKLIDFGISALRHGENEKNGLGTKGYAAPEQYKETVGTIDARTDIYGLGATLYHLVTGTRLKEIGNENIRLLERTKISEDLKKVIEKALQPNPDNRYQDITCLMDDLKSINSLSLGDKSSKVKLFSKNPFKRIKA